VSHQVQAWAETNRVQRGNLATDSPEGKSHTGADVSYTIYIGFSVYFLESINAAL